MTILILFIVGVSIFTFFYGKNEQDYGFFSRFRLAFVQTLLFSGLLAFLSTEILSYFSVLNTPFIACFWALVLLIFIYYNFQKKYWILSSNDFIDAIQVLSQKERLLFYCTGLIYLFPLVYLAVVAPPNNTDSANYHLARIVFWLQNQNVEHYPTVYIQQLYHNVFSEYILLHIMALYGWQDYFTNLVQWLAMLGSVFGIGLVGKLFGFERKIQVFLSVLQLTLPIGILESTTTQNDYIANFLFLAFLYFGLSLLKSKDLEIVDIRCILSGFKKDTKTKIHLKSIRLRLSKYLENHKIHFKSIPLAKNTFWMALALALGGFNKYTVFLFGFPICIWIGVVLLKNYPFKYSLRVFLLASGMLMLVFTPFFKRNYALFGNVLSATTESPLFTEDVATQRKCIGCVTSVTLKNLTAHLGLPIQSYNQQIDRLVAMAHQWLGVPLNDPALNVDNYYTRFVIQEDMSHNPWHFVLIGIAAIWLVFHKNQRIFKILLLCAVTGFLLFSTLIKYQIYNTRVIMPFFSMGFVWTGVMVSRWADRWRNLLVILFLLAGLPYIFTNYNKSVLPLRQLSKYVLGYIPPFLCVKDGNIEGYRSQFKTIYDFNKGVPCFPLKAMPTYLQRMTIVGQLQALGYYKNEEQPFWAKSREENYFTEMYDLGQYNDLKAIVAHIGPEAQGVAVLWGNVLGFYREWLLVKNHLGHAVPMQYILYQQKCQDAPNASRPFVYDYVLLDHPDLIEKYLDKNQIASATTTKHYILVKLKTPATKQYTYISRAEVEKYETRN